MKSEDQKELLEDVLDSLDKTNNSISKVEPFLPELVALLKEQKDNTGKNNQKSAPVIDRNVIKSAVSECFDDYEVAPPEVNFVLTRDNIDDLVDGIYKGIVEHVKQQNSVFRKNKEKAEAAEADRLKEARTVQGLYSIEQVAEWAPQFPPLIQRLIRFLGILMFDTEANPDDVHRIMTILGDTFMVNIGQQGSWSAAFGKTWNKTITWLKNWKVATLIACLYSFIMVLVMLSYYHGKVIEVDMRNRIIDHYWKHDRYRQREIQQLDSILQHEGRFDAWNWTDNHQPNPI